MVKKALLTEQDKGILLDQGFLKRDFSQIEKALKKTDFVLIHAESGRNRRISASEASEILGREVFLSGIGRSAFHWSSIRELGTGEIIYFDSAKLFKG